MNREIKFRAKPINLSFKYDDGEEGKVEWVYGYYSRKTTYSEPVSLGECTVEHFINVNCIPQSSEFEWFVTDFCKQCDLEDDYHNAFDNDNVSVYSDTVGQYIGICDTSTPPKEIYDGDIIEGKSGIRHLVKYDDDSAAFLAYKLPLNEFDNGCHIENDWVVKFEKKVIGNVFDNGTLLKK